MLNPRGSRARALGCRPLGMMVGASLAALLLLACPGLTNWKADLGLDDDRPPVVVPKTLAESVVDELVAGLSAVPRSADPRISRGLSSSSIDTIKTKALSRVISEGLKNSTALDKIIPPIARGMGEAIAGDLGISADDKLKTLGSAATLLIESATKPDRVTNVSVGVTIEKVAAIAPAAVVSVAPVVLAGDRTKIESALRTISAASIAQISELPSIGASEAKLNTAFAEVVSAITESSVSSMASASLPSASLGEAVAMIMSSASFAAKDVAAAKGLDAQAIASTLIDASFKGVETGIKSSVAAAGSATELVATVAASTDAVAAVMNVTIAAVAVQEKITAAAAAIAAIPNANVDHGKVSEAVAESAPIAVGKAKSGGRSDFFLAEQIVGSGTISVTLDASESVKGLGWSSGLAYTWRQISGPNLFGEVLQTTKDLTLSQGGVYVFELEVKNSGGRKASYARVTVVLSIVPAPMPEIGLSYGGLALPSGTRMGFGSCVVNGVSGSKLLLITNTGAADLNVGSIRLEGAAAADFRVVATAGSLEPGAASLVLLTFEPKSSGIKSASLVIVSDDQDEPSYVIHVGGEAVAAPSPKIFVSEGPYEIASGTTISFGTVQVGQKPGKSILVKNTGTAPLAISKMQLEGANPSAFALSASGAKTIEAGAQLSLVVSYEPPATGTHAATLLIESDGGNLSIKLNGEAVSPSTPKIAVIEGISELVTGSTLSFGTVQVGQKPGKSILVKNTGTAPLAISKMQLEGTNPSAFALSVSGAETIEAGGQVTLVVSYEPPATGTHAATLLIESDGGNLSIKLTGGAVAAPTPKISVTEGTSEIVNGTTMDFGTVSVGQQLGKSILIKNTGTASLAITKLELGGANPGAFDLSVSGAGTIVAGAELSTMVSYEPVAAGVHTATLLIESSGGNLSINLRGNVMQSGKVEVTINPGDANPLAATIIPSRSSGLMPGDSLTLTASYSGTPTSILWQRAGRTVGTGSTYSIASLPAGLTRIDLIVVDGARSSSATLSLYLDEPGEMGDLILLGEDLRSWPTAVRMSRLIEPRFEPGAKVTFYAGYVPNSGLVGSPEIEWSVWGPDRVLRKSTGSTLVIESLQEGFYRVDAVLRAGPYSGSARWTMSLSPRDEL